MQRKTALLLTVIVAMAFTVRIAVMIHFRSYEISPEAGHWGFGFEAGRLARSLALGEGFSSPLIEKSGPSAFLPAGFPLLLAGIFKVFGVYTEASAIAVYAFNSLAAALTSLALYRLGRRLFGENVGLVIAVVFALHPSSIWHSVNTIWDVSVLTLLLVVLVDWLYVLPSPPSTQEVVRFGLFMGFVAFVNSAPVVFFPAVVFLVWSRARRSGASGFKEVALLAGCCLLLYLPWLVRNLLTVGVFAPRTGSGLNLRIGNNEQAWRTGTGTADLSIYPTNSAQEGRLFYQLGEVEYDRYCQRLATEFIQQNPGKFISLTLMRIRTWWLGQGDDWAIHFKLAFRLSTWKRLLSLAPLPFFLIGLAIAWRRGKPVGILLALMLTYPIPYYFFFVTHRYRFPLEPFMLLLSVYGALSMLTWLRAKRRRLSPLQ